MEEIYFVHRIRRTGGVWDKGIEVKDAGTSRENDEAARQSYHAFLGAYAYGKHAETDYTSCFITDTAGNRVLWEKWDGRPKEQPQPEPDPPAEAE